MQRTAIVTSFLWLALITASAQAVPAIYTIEIDASGLVSDSEFRTACRAVADFADQLFEQARTSFAATPDWLSVNLFGAPGESLQSGYINCSDPASLRFLKLWLGLLEQPLDHSSAAFEAVRNGAHGALAHDARLPRYYANRLILVTAGNPDALSSRRVISEVSELFPNGRLQLFVIGTSAASTAAFAGLAELALEIEDFDALAPALRQISLRRAELPRLHAGWKLLE